MADQNENIPYKVGAYMFGNFFDDAKWYQMIYLVPLILLVALIEEISRSIPKRRKK